MQRQISSVMVLVLSLTTTRFAIPGDNKPAAQEKEGGAQFSGPDSSKAESKKKNVPADPELAALQKQLDSMTLQKLKQLRANDSVAYDRWRQQNHLNGNCQISRKGSDRFAAPIAREAELVAQCQAWQQKMRMIEKTISSRERGEGKPGDGSAAQDRKAFETHLDTLPMDKLRQLVATEHGAYDRFREQNHLAPNCSLSKDRAGTQAKEAELVTKCKEWKAKVELIDAAMARREKASEKSGK